jgi:PKHD-type hydroxylase
MLVTFPLLDADTLRHAHSLLASAAWTDGRASAGEQAAQVKNNEQLPPESEAARALSALVVAALDRHPTFLAAALPRKVFPPRFNRYAGASNHYGQHVDNAIRLAGQGDRVRTDLSCTVFLADPADYDGGELRVRDGPGSHLIKLPAGHAVLYPGDRVHEVMPVTRGERLASFFWVESMVRDPQQRHLLWELDQSLMALRGEHGESPTTVALTGTYHNLLRMWAQT